MSTGRNAMAISYPRPLPGTQGVGPGTRSSTAKSRLAPTNSSFARLRRSRRRLFTGEFFQGTVLKVKLVEAAIRQAMAAIGIVHEQAVLGRPHNPEEQGNSIEQARWKRFDPLNVSIQLYNRLIRAIINEVISEPSSLSLVAMISILFTCFDCFQGNTGTAAAHLKRGISLLQGFREIQTPSVTLRGTNYTSWKRDV